ncbi:MAG TPA: hypothetical protein VFT65_15355 [Candidatus Angelobacter sp.]|nr:hypothetical protein [Candidatus Angelobacter sp.]
MTRSKRLFLFATSALLFVLAGCRAHMITIKLVNTSAQPISTIIVDYPSATFGKDQLAPGETFSSPVKITEAGPLKAQFVDATGARHTYTLPGLRPNDEGSIEVSLNQTGASAVTHLAGR